MSTIVALTLIDASVTSLLLLSSLLVALLGDRRCAYDGCAGSLLMFVIGRCISIRPYDLVD